MIRSARKPLALLIVAAFASPLMAAPPAPDALPSGGRVTAGAASIAQAGARMDVTQTSERAILEWQRFDIGAAAQVNFAQPSVSSIALNRVLAGEASQIMGRLSANGQVYLVNPSGVIFGAGSRVDVGGLVASALDVSDTDFLAGRNVFNRFGAAGKVLNRGTINAREGGLVALLAPEVRNEGVIAARLGNVVLAAGERVTLEAGANGRLQVAVDPATLATLVDNRQMIVADGGQVVMSAQAADRLYSAVVANSGTVQAHTLENRDGRILLLADMDHGQVQVGGTLDASAPSPLAGEGWGEGANGGFVETSAAKVNIADDARVVTLAASGHHGTWLIDPNDYTIAAAGGNITGATLAANLGGGNVTISTATQGTAGGNGDIFVNDAVSWNANTTLSLQAQRDIQVNANVTASGNTAGLTLGYGAGRDYYLNNAARITLSGSTPVLKIGTAGAEATYTVINSLGVAGDASTTTLQGMKNNLTGKYALGSDIDASATAGWNAGAGFEPIVGSVFDPDFGWEIAGFTGVLTGLGHTINSLTINRPVTDYVGLIGFFSGGQLRNIGVLNGNVIGHDIVGGLIGMVDDSGGTIKNTFYSGAVQGNALVGGLIGENRTTVSNSYSSGSVTGTGTSWGNSFVGGLVGISYHGPIDNSYSMANVTGAGPRVGGLVGDNDFSHISNSYSTGAVSGTGAHVGGLVGINRDDWGNFDATQVTGCYWNTQSSDQGTSSGGAPLTTALMKQQASFAGWDFTNTWRIYEGQSFPVLRALQTNLTVTANNATKTYDGIAYSDGNGVSYSVAGAPLAGTVAYTGTSQGAVNAGSYTIAPGGLSFNRTSQQDYQNWGDIAFANGTLTVNMAALTVTANAASKTYNGLAYSGGNGVGYSGLVNSETATVLGGTLAYGGNAQGATNAGSYTITPAGLTAGNYSISFANGALTIGKAHLTVTADDMNKTYGEAIPLLTATIGGLVNGETLANSGVTGSPALATPATEASDVGTAPIAATLGTLAAANYDFTTFDPGALAIAVRPLTVSAHDAAKTADEPDPAMSFAVTTGSLFGTDALSGSLSRASGEAPDSYAIGRGTLDAGANYALSFVDGRLTIAARPAARKFAPLDGSALMRELARTQDNERRAAPPADAAGAALTLPHMQVRADFIALPGER